MREVVVAFEQTIRGVAANTNLGNPEGMLAYTSPMASLKVLVVEIGIAPMVGSPLAIRDRRAKLRNLKLVYRRIEGESIVVHIDGYAVRAIAEHDVIATETLRRHAHRRARTGKTLQREVIVVIESKVDIVVRELDIALFIKVDNRLPNALPRVFHTRIGRRDATLDEELHRGNAHSAGLYVDAHAHHLLLIAAESRPILSKCFIRRASSEHYWLLLVGQPLEAERADAHP